LDQLQVAEKGLVYGKEVNHMQCSMPFSRSLSCIFCTVYSVTSDFLFASGCGWK